MRHNQRSSVLVLLALLTLFPGCATNPELASLTGAWQGFIDWPTPETRTELEIGIGSEGELDATFHFRDFGGSNIKVPKLSLDGRTLSATAESGFPKFEGQLQPDGEVLEGELSLSDRTLSVSLRRNNPSFRKFEVPRLTPDGQREQVYTYKQPEVQDDGWKTETMDAAGLDSERINAFLRRVLAGEHGHAESVLIARNGKLVVEEYFHGYSRDRIHTIQSITKSVTSLLFGCAKDRGRIKRLDLPVSIFFPEYAERKWIKQNYDINLYHLLTMSAAIDWNEIIPYSDPQNSNTAMNASEDWIGYVLDRDLVGKPGEISSYTSGLAILLGGILKNVTGKYVDEYADETLFKELGITSYHWGAHQDGTRHTGGGLWLRPRDLAKIGQVVLGKGIWNNTGVVSEKWIEESTKPHLPVEEERSTYSPSYGYQWWRDRYDVNGVRIEVIGGHGYGGQYLGIIPSLDMVVVLTAGEYVDISKRKFSYFKIVEEEILPAVNSIKT